MYVLPRCIDYRICSRGTGTTRGADADGLTGIQKALRNIPKAFCNIPEAFCNIPKA